MVYLVNSRKHMFTYRRKEIKHKWKNEKVFGSDHDNEVSRYRILREITAQNLKRNTLHAPLFVTLALFAGLCKGSSHKMGTLRIFPAGITLMIITIVSWL